jgi:hypothetical protein
MRLVCRKLYRYLQNDVFWNVLHVVLVGIDLSEEHIASIFRVKAMIELKHVNSSQRVKWLATANVF